MQYLQLSRHNGPDVLPRPITCFGTEPFWSLDATPREDSYADSEDGFRGLTVTSEHATRSGFTTQFTDDQGINRTLFVARGLCGDGMSSRNYGWQATLKIGGPEHHGTLTGCCTMDTNNQ